MDKQKARKDFESSRSKCAEVEHAVGTWGTEAYFSTNGENI